MHITAMYGVVPAAGHVPTCTTRSRHVLAAPACSALSPPLCCRYNTIISACSKAGQPGAAARVYERMLVSYCCTAAERRS